MNLLLDTCDFLRFISGDSALPERTRKAVQDPDNQVFLSVVSLWEAIIKHALGKLPLPQPPESYIPAQRAAHEIRSLSLDESSVKRLAGLPSHHRDPFDHKLVCQALELDLHLASSDAPIRFSVALRASSPSRQSVSALAHRRACCGRTPRRCSSAAARESRAL